MSELIAPGGGAPGAAAPVPPTTSRRIPVSRIVAGLVVAVVLIALPFALFGFLLNTKPDYVESLWTTELGRKMSLFAIIAQIIGALVIRKIVNIKV